MGKCFTIWGLPKFQNIPKKGIYSRNSTPFTFPKEYEVIKLKGMVVSKGDTIFLPLLLSWNQKTAKVVGSLILKFEEKSIQKDRLDFKTSTLVAEITTSLSYYINLCFI